MIGIGRWKGWPLLKPWRVVTDCPQLAQKLNKKCYQGCHGNPPWKTHDNRDHGICEGDETKHTEGYTWNMVQCIHEGHSDYVRRLGKDIIDNKPFVVA